MSVLAIMRTLFSTLKEERTQDIQVYHILIEYFPKEDIAFATVAGVEEYRRCHYAEGRLHDTETLDEFVVRVIRGIQEGDS